MYKIDRRGVGEGVQKSYTRTDPYFIILRLGQVKTMSGPSAAGRTG